MSTPFKAIFFGVLLALIALFWMASFAKAHDWYDIGCCNDGDCERVPIEAVQDVGNGYMVHVVSERFGAVSEFFPEAEVRLSKDGNWHACFMKASAMNPRRLRCLYKPVMF